MSRSYTARFWRRAAPLALLVSCVQVGCEREEKGTSSPSPPAHNPPARVDTLKLPETPPPRTPEAPALLLDRLPPVEGATFALGETTTTLASVGRQRCRTGDLLQALVVDKEGKVSTRSLLTLAPARPTASPRKLLVVASGKEYPATLEQREGVITLRFDNVMLTYPNTHDGVLADEGLGQAGCFHTGRFTLSSPGNLEGPVTGLRSDSTESFAFHMELSPTHAITAMVYMPAHRFDTARPVEANLREAFEDPRGAIVRVFFEERQTRQDMRGVERAEWTQIPAKDGTLKVKFEGSATRPLARVHLEEVSVPASWGYPLPEGAKISLEAHASIITDHSGKIIPPAPRPVP